MQQIAASHKDIADPGLFPGDSVTSDVNGAGVEFAKVLENNASGSNSSGTNSAEQGEQGYRGHGDFFEAEQSNTNLEDCGTGDNTPAFADKEHGEGQSESSLTQGSQAEDAVIEVDEDLHNEWVSIIQKLNGDDSIKMSEVSGDSLPLEGGLDLQQSMIAEQNEAGTQFSDGKFSGSEESTVISIDDGPDKENVEIVEDSEVFTQELLSQSPLSNTEQWKEDLKQKLLNSGHQLNIHQVKAVDKDLQSMSDEQIQKMLNDDQSFKQMLSDILNVQEPDPQDVALLLALAEQDNGSQNSISLEDLMNQNAELESGGATANQNAELESGGASANQNAELESVGASANQNAVLESVGATANQNVELEFGDVTANQNVNAEQGSAEEDLSTARIAMMGAEIEQDIDAALSEVTTKEPLISNDNSEPKIASTSVPTEEPSKQQPLKLEQLLSDLDSTLKSDEQKLTAVENLTRRVESSGIGQTPAGKSFIDSMKQVATDLKEQLKAGSETNFNLQHLVADAVNADSGKLDAVALEGQVRGALQQMVNVTQNHLALEPAARDNLLSSFQSSMNRDSGSAQLEAAKTQQQNVQNQIMDKAVNIQKPEAAVELANKVQVMMNQKNMVADIRLDPPDLGQMQIKIAMQGDSASVSMVVQSQAAREALEHNQPRLKELLEQQGIELGQSSVQEESQGNKGEGDGSNFASGKGKEAAEDITSEMDGESYVAVNEPEGIDYFA